MSEYLEKRDLFRPYKPIRSKTVKVRHRIRRQRYRNKVYEYDEYFLSLYIHIPRHWIEEFGDKWVIEYYNYDRRRRDPRPRIIIYPEKGGEK